MWMIVAALLAAFGTIPARAWSSDPLAAGRHTPVRMRSVMLTFGGRVPGGLAVNSTTRLAKGLSVDAGVGVSRPVGSAFLGTLAIPAVMYAEVGSTELLRAGIGYTWTPLRSDGMMLVSAGFMSANPNEDIAFGLDLTWTPDRRLASEPFYYFTVIGLSVGIRL